jgi:hypothetical protein
LVPGPTSPEELASADKLARLEADSAELVVAPAAAVLQTRTTTTIEIDAQSGASRHRFLPASAVLLHTSGISFLIGHWAFTIVHGTLAYARCKTSPRLWQLAIRKRRLRIFNANAPPFDYRLPSSGERLPGVRKHMSDLVYIGIVVLFFVIAGLYAHLCEKM